MKNKLDIAREIINEVDNEMIKLFKKRMEAASLVAEYKAENNLPILDSKREEAIILKNINLLDNEELKQYYITFFNGVLKSSKDYQEDLLK